MKPYEAVQLSQVLKVISKPKYILGTTYSLSLAFFEANVFPLFRRSDLESCLIICDQLGYQHALSECPALMGAGQDYAVTYAPVTGCFHPKVWLVLGEGEAVLLVGSGNLTQAGFMTNAEFFDAVFVDAHTAHWLLRERRHSKFQSAVTIPMLKQLFARLMQLFAMHPAMISSPRLPHLRRLRTKYKNSVFAALTLLAFAILGSKKHKRYSPSSFFRNCHQHPALIERSLLGYC